MQNENMIQNIKTALKHQERNGAWLSRRLGVDRTTVHCWLQYKKNMPTKYCKPIADALGIPKGILFPNGEIK